MPAVEKRDLFGRTEAEILRDIAYGERLYLVASYYSGNEGLAINLARDKANLGVDRRELARLRGQKVEGDPIRLLAGADLVKWRSHLIRLGRAGVK